MNNGISLTSTQSKSYTLKALMSGAAATTNPRCTVFYHDILRQFKPDVMPQLPGSQEAQLSGTNEVAICDAPAQDVARMIDGINVYNEDTAAVTITVFRDDGTTNWILSKKLLAVGQTLHADAFGNWQII